MFTEHTVETPAWIRALVDDIMECVTPLGFIGPLGYRYQEPAEQKQSDQPDEWQLVVYPTANEIRGSDKNDGALFVSGFRLDVSRMIGFMCSVEEVVWNSPIKYGGDLDGPEISLRGRYTSKQVCIRFFHMPPSDEPPAYAVNPGTGEFTELTA